MTKTIGLKRKAHREYMRKWRKRNYEKVKKYRREQGRKAKKRKWDLNLIKQCEYCNNEFKPHKLHPHQKYCSSSCQKKFYQPNERKKHPERTNARARAWRWKQKRKFCLICLLEGKEMIAKDFHHIDYRNNLGFSVCRKHHKKVDEWI